VCYANDAAPGHGEALESASSVLFYVSKSSLQSSHCNREINLALAQRIQQTPPVAAGLKNVRSQQVRHLNILVDHRICRSVNLCLQ
jgi:hypothetical protein|tara:strand:- start:167 stop:424 length:258 start_codon:yes stop_codon:yes gene_type:complete